ncbi:hypothetical protein, partial [Vibrio parahaemolyticus]|uniref:hypothetical protein n=1 Tax=Vibrio parahaemolyticus TaxID=670 RepID=UPI0021134214
FYVVYINIRNFKWGGGLFVYFLLVVCKDGGFKKTCLVLLVYFLVMLFLFVACAVPDAVSAQSNCAASGWAARKAEAPGAA